MAVRSAGGVPLSLHNAGQQKYPQFLISNLRSRSVILRHISMSDHLPADLACAACPELLSKPSWPTLTLLRWNPDNVNGRLYKSGRMKDMDDTQVSLTRLRTESGRR